MLTVSLHGIRINAPHGLYPEEHILGNEFEIDVDIWLATDNGHPWPFVDYALIQNIVANTFQQQGQLLEKFVHSIHSGLKMNVPDAQKVKVAVRKIHPPLNGYV